MAVAYRDSTSQPYALRNPTTVLTAPSGIQNDDILVIVYTLYYGSAGATATPPANFNVVTGFPYVIGGYETLYIWWKVASGESGNYTITHSGDKYTQAWIGAYYGANTTTPLNPATTRNTGGGTTSTATGLTTVEAGSMVIFYDQDTGDTANSLTPPTGTTPTFVERLDTSGGVSTTLYIADGVVTNASTSTGNKTQTNNNAGSNPWQAGLIALNASVAAPIPKSLGDSGAVADVITGQLITFTSPNYGSSTASISGIDPTDWVNPGNVYADDTSYATWSP